MVEGYHVDYRTRHRWALEEMPRGHGSGVDTRVAAAANAAAQKFARVSAVELAVETEVEVEAEVVVAVVVVIAAAFGAAIGPEIGFGAASESEIVAFPVFWKMLPPLSRPPRPHRRDHHHRLFWS